MAGGLKAPGGVHAAGAAVAGGEAAAAAGPCISLSADPEITRVNSLGPPNEGGGAAAKDGSVGGVIGCDGRGAAGGAIGARGAIGDAA